VSAAPDQFLDNEPADVQGRLDYECRSSCSDGHAGEGDGVHNLLNHLAIWIRFRVNLMIWSLMMVKGFNFAVPYLHTPGLGWEKVRRNDSNWLTNVFRLL
jgi:hypothetical protein